MAVSARLAQKTVASMPPHQQNEWLAYYELQYRNNTQSRRQNRGLADHDIFEGLPVRNWRRDIVVVAPPPAHNALNQQSDKWDVELPWGMPKDAHLMPQHSQDLLRAARSGRLYQKRPLMEDDQDEDVLMADKPEKKEVEPKDDGFTVKTWKLVPKHLEGPEVEYLAKRRKGLRGAVVGSAAQGPTMTKMTVRKVDDQGNSFIEHVVVPEGQAVDGEVISQTVVTDAATTLGVAEPLKRRPPPPKRKAKGPGRGRKKKVMLAPTSAPTEAGAPAVDGKAVVVPVAEGIVSEAGVKQESTATPSADNEDTEMGEGSQAQSDDDGEDGEEGSDDASEEGEILDEDQEREDEEEKARDLENERERERMIKANSNQSMEHKLPAKPAISDFGMEIPGGSFPSSRVSQGRDFGGSPLKNTFTPRSYSPSVHNPEDEAEGDEDEEEEPHNGRTSHRGSGHVSRAPSEPSFEPQHHSEILPNMADTMQEALQVQEDGDGDFQDMLADMSPEGTDSMLLDAGGGSQDTVLAQPLGDDSLKLPNEEAEAEGHDQIMGEGDVGEEENFVDLLGGLEEHLNEHEAAASANLLSRSESAPEAQESNLQAEDEEEKEKPAADDVEVDRMTPAQMAAEAEEVAAEASPPADEKAASAEPETVEEVPVHDAPKEVETTVKNAAVVAPLPPAIDEQPVVEEAGLKEGALEKRDEEDVTKDADA